MGSYARSVQEKMLANLTSLIWGSESTPTTTTTTTSAVVTTTTTCPTSEVEAPETQSLVNIRASTPADEEESDWVLVDRAASPSSQPSPVENEDSPMREDAGDEAGRQVVEAPATRSSVSQRAATLLQAIDVLRPAQKAQRRREERRLKRKPLERSNKAREVAAAGNKRAKRNDMMVPGKFSRAVNNRKC
ncbi:uncharacterized protein LOC121855847 isoform X4 [Homarus americanus]|uniref:uncharacterized protein LOC121855847 isoform X4 n=1 Tax=Homarus americanus TaxID=6706 RepID=UPI001C46A3A2|nr:uncharacterized protein LOC121855847 isoform X4 [Homarus americanus]